MFKTFEFHNVDMKPELEHKKRTTPMRGKKTRHPSCKKTKLYYLNWKFDLKIRSCHCVYQTLTGAVLRMN